MSSLASISGANPSIEMLIQQYMAIERRPILALQKKITDLNNKIGLFNDFKGKLEALKDAADTLADTSNDSVFRDVKVTSDDQDVLSITSSDSAAQGSYIFRIRQLATSTTMKSTATLNTHASTKSDRSVVAGSGSLDIDEAWADAGFDTMPDGTVTINGATYALAHYDTVEDFIDAVNDDASMTGSDEVVSGAGTLDTAQTWALAGFDTAPDGTVTINGVEFTLSSYTTVDDFMDAVNDHGTANASIAYDADTDRFTVSSTDGSTLTLSETGTNGFLTETHLTGPSLANLFYDEDRDRFVVESTDDGDLVIAETGSHGFFTEAHIDAGTYSTNQTGVDSSDFLYRLNFDEDVERSDSGSFMINGATIEWDADTDTLGSLIADINASEAGVTAFYDDTLDKVVFTAEDTGSEEIEWEDVEGSFLASVLNLSGVTQDTGQDAQFTINSTDAADEITSASNEFSINNLTVTLKGVTVENDAYDDSDTSTVTVRSEKDETTVRQHITSFLKKYNELIDYLKAKTAVNVSTYSRGALAGESVFVSLKSDIIGLLLGQVTDLDEDKPSYLSDIGITLDDSLHASISDSTQLSDWMDDDPQAVSNLFNSTNGVAAQMVSLIEPFSETYGILDDRKDILGDQIDTMESRIDRLEERLENREAYYRTQFTTLQETLSMVTYQQSVISNLMSSFTSQWGLA